MKEEEREGDVRWEILQLSVGAEQRGTGREKETSAEKEACLQGQLAEQKKKGAPKPDSGMVAQGAEVLTLESGDT